MDFTDALSELADIHMPGDISWWPLAPGWWILAVLLLAAVAFSSWRLQQRTRLQRRLGGALSELDRARAILTTGDADADLQYVNQVNAVLRRVALLHLDAERVAGLSGQAWVDFLRSHDRAGLLNTELASVLAQGRFARRCNVNADELERMARAWIKNLYIARIDNHPNAAAEQHA